MSDCMLCSTERIRCGFRIVTLCIEPWRLLDTPNGEGRKALSRLLVCYGDYLHHSVGQDSDIGFETCLTFGTCVISSFSLS